MEQLTRVSSELVLWMGEEEHHHELDDVGGQEMVEAASGSLGNHSKLWKRTRLHGCLGLWSSF